MTLAELHAEGSQGRRSLRGQAQGVLSPRTIGFDVQGCASPCIGYRRDRILQSVHASDIGRLINPKQCRGQIDGAIAMGFGWALYEKMVYDERGAMLNPALRDYAYRLRRRAAQRNLFRRHPR